MGGYHVHNAAWVNNALRMNVLIWRILYGRSSIEDALKIALEMPIIVYALRSISALQSLCKRITIERPSPDQVNAFKLLSCPHRSVVPAIHCPLWLCPNQWSLSG